ncbi:MAG: ArnT family glycosyltransferase [Candidatus Saccharimonadia bacterium]
MSKKVDTLKRIYDNRFSLGFYLILIVAAYFFLNNLNTLPPGLSPAEASNATLILGILRHSAKYTTLLHNGSAGAVFSVMQLLSVKIFGPTLFALRLPAALIGLFGVALMYVLGTLWYDQRVGVLASLFAATTPWTVGFSRFGTAAILPIIIVPLVLSALIIAFRQREIGWFIFAGLIIGGSFSAISGLWLAFGLLLSCATLLYTLAQKNQLLERAHLIMFALIVILGLPLAIWRFSAHPPKLTLSNVNAHDIATRTADTLTGFVLHGDDNYLYNIPGTPELNLFVGLMFIVGVLVCGMRFEKARYRTLLILFCVLLIPVVASSQVAPSSESSIVLAPIVFILAAVGINYMLEIWFSTFPINSAARTLGTVPIVVLLLMGIYQGYQQYFVAWANSPDLADSFDNNARELAGYLNRTSFGGQRYVVSTGTSAQIIDFLSFKRAEITDLPMADISKLPIGSPQKQIIFIPTETSGIIGDLKSRFPKARLSQHYSELNDNTQTFAVYQTQQ